MQRSIQFVFVNDQMAPQHFKTGGFTFDKLPSPFVEKFSGSSTVMKIFSDLFRPRLVDLGVCFLTLKCSLCRCVQLETRSCSRRTPSLRSSICSACFRTVSSSVLQRSSSVSFPLGDDSDAGSTDSGRAAAISGFLECYYLLADPFRDLRDDGIAEGSNSVNPSGNPMSHSTHTGFNVPPI